MPSCPPVILPTCPPAHLPACLQVVVVLSDHEFFGEQSVVSDALCTASVRAASYCDMAILLREHFQQAHLSPVCRNARTLERLLLVY